MISHAEEVAAAPTAARRARWIEIGVVLLFGFAPSAIGQIVRGKGLTGPLLPYYEFFSCLTMIGLLLYIVWSRDGSLLMMGIKKPNWFLDPLLGIGLCSCFFVFNVFMRIAIPHDLYVHWYSMGKPSPVQEEIFGRLPLWTVFPPLLVINTFEELLMRGYLTGRLLSLIPAGWAILLSSLCFASWHFYEGPIGFINALLIGLTLASIFALTRRIWPLIVAHFSYDAFITLMYVAYLGRHGHGL